MNEQRTLVTDGPALVHLRSFEAVTGRKREDWLVKANGAIFLAVGAGLGMAALRHRLTQDWRMLAVTLGFPTLTQSPVVAFAVAPLVTSKMYRASR
jgi:hypothetical protein